MPSLRQTDGKQLSRALATLESGTAEGNCTWPCREPKLPLIALISMNCSHARVSQKKGGPRWQRIPIQRWKDVDFIVPMVSALPGGRIRDCALKPPAVIRERPPGTRVCSCLAGRIRPARLLGSKFGRRARVDLGGRGVRRFAGRSTP